MNPISKFAKIGVLVMLSLLTVYPIFAQKTTKITGQVLTDDGKPAASVTVKIVEINKLEWTDDNGKYSFTLPDGNYTIEINQIGLKPIRKTIKVPAESDQEYQIKITESASQLNNVTVVYGGKGNMAVTSIGKSDVPSMFLPQSITVINQKIMDDQQVQRLSDLMKNVNGVYLAGARASTQETFYARGYNFSSSNMFKNGFRVNTGAIPEMSSLESIEILKGSAAILYGNVAPGGILNMVTKKPKFTWGGSINMRAGSYALYKPEFDVYGPLSKNVAFRVNGTYETMSSYRDSVHSKRYYINPSFLFKLGEKTTLLVQGDYLHHKFTPDFGIGSINGLYVPDVPRSRFMGASWQYAKTEQATASLELNHRFNADWKLSYGASFQNYERDYYSLERIQADSTGKWKRPLGKTNNKENYYATQINLNGKFKTGPLEHYLLVGADADKYDQKNLASDITGKIYDSINILQPDMYVRRSDIPTANWVSRANVGLNRFGVYVQDLISISEHWKALAGVRFSYQDAVPTKTDSLLKNKTVEGKRQIDKAFSPRFGIVYLPIPTTSIFASYSTSFSPNTGTDVNNNALKPSIIDQYELGVKNDLFEGKVSANVTIYRIVNSNLAQTAQYDANGNPNSNTNFKELSGETTSDGVEVDLRATIFKGLNAIAGYSYNNMRYTKTIMQVGGYVEGQRLVNTPKNTANITLFYTVEDGALKNFRVGTGWYYVGNRFGGWNATYVKGANNTLAINNRLIPINGYSTFDISAGYSYQKFSLMAKLSNIFNAYNYLIHENYSINPIPPRQIMATLSYRF